MKPPSNNHQHPHLSSVASSLVTRTLAAQGARVLNNPSISVFLKVGPNISKKPYNKAWRIHGLLKNLLAFPTGTWIYWFVAMIKLTNTKPIRFRKINLHTLPKANIAPENRPSQKETSTVFQPSILSIFRCQLYVSRRVLASEAEDPPSSIRFLPWFLVAMVAGPEMTTYQASNYLPIRLSFSQ